MLHKYVRTPHIKGSRKSKGDDLEDVDFSFLKGKYLVVEEKIDGANCGISFEDGKLMLQTRGHYMIGGPREAQFSLLKTWAGCHEHRLKTLLGETYVMYGEWMFAKHTEFYDLLPHYFMEFDMLNKQTLTFLSTKKRQELIHSSEMNGRIFSVPVLKTGIFDKVNGLNSLITNSLYKSPGWKEKCRTAAMSIGVYDIEQHTDMSDLSEGLYVKHEKDDSVIGRFKLVRSDFTNAILDQGEHWLNRRIVQNQLRDDLESMFI